MLGRLTITDPVHVEAVLARSIPSVELLGATTVLCVDKMGTIERE